MRLLLDTCALIWWSDDQTRLSPPARSAIADSSNSVAVSIVSFWEIALKIATGRLAVSSDLLTFIQRTQSDGIEIVPIPLTAPHAVAQMPFHHNDPFDRMIAVTAQLDVYQVVTPDVAFDSYGVPRVW